MNLQPKASVSPPRYRIFNPKNVLISDIVSTFFFVLEEKVRLNVSLAGRSSYWGGWYPQTQKWSNAY